MRKKLKKIFCLTLVLIISLMPGLSVSAATITIENSNQSIDSIDCPFTEITDGIDYENLAQYLIQLPTDSKELIIPVKMAAKGISYMYFYDKNYADTSFGDILADENSYSDMYFQLYQDSTCTDSSLVDEEYSESLYGLNLVSLNVPSQGNYYIKITLANDIKNENSIYILNAFGVSGEDRVLQNGVTSLTGAINDKPIYYKLMAPNDGYITLDFLEDVEYTWNNIKITLCDSNKKVISKTINMNTHGNKAIFAVSKGEYYVSVSANSSYQDCIYELNSRFVQIKENSGSKLSNSKKISLGKTIKGLQTLGNTKADWYKFEVKKKKDFSITLNKYMTVGNMKFTLYDKNKKEVKYNSHEKDNKVTYIPSTKLSKGTYYIKIEKTNQLDSGYYSLMVK